MPDFAASSSLFQQCYNEETVISSNATESNTAACEYKENTSASVIEFSEGTPDEDKDTGVADVICSKPLTKINRRKGLTPSRSNGRTCVSPNVNPFVIKAEKMDGDDGHVFPILSSAWHKEQNFNSSANLTSRRDDSNNKISIINAFCQNNLTEDSNKNVALIDSKSLDLCEVTECDDLIDSTLSAMDTTQSPSYNEILCDKCHKTFPNSFQLNAHICIPQDTCGSCKKVIPSGDEISHYFDCTPEALANQSVTTLAEYDPERAKRALRNAREKQRLATLSPEEKQARARKRAEQRRDQYRKKQKDMTEEEKAAFNAKRAKRERERIAKLDPVQKELRKRQHAAKERERRNNMDPEKKEMLRLKHAQRERERRKHMDPLKKEIHKLQKAIYERERRQNQTF